MSREDSFDESTIIATSELSLQGQLALVVLTGSQLETFKLPMRGEVVIGRAPSCDVRLSDGSVSRQHARLKISDSIALEDLASANGTRIGERRLEPGETTAVEIGTSFEIGAVSVLLQRLAERRRTHRVWPHGYFEGRVDDECVRTSGNKGTFAICALRLTEDTSAQQVNDAFAALLSPTDVVGEYASGHYEILFVDLDPAEAQKRTEKLQRDLTGVGIQGQLGLACFPADGTSADALIPAAFAATGQERKEVDSDGEFIVRAPSMIRLHNLVAQVASGDISVLLLGETGVGKEVVAERVHNLSQRKKGPFVRLNCAALSPSLLESELFGHEKGSFTGAIASKPGLLETAAGGTVFLDEAGEIPLSTQVKLLRVLEERKVLRVGGLEPRDVNVRFVAATNRDLEAEIQQGTFREDLYYRLAGVTIPIPPLRERKEEIEPLIQRFVTMFSPPSSSYPVIISPAALEMMRDYSWPGNIRELRNAIERAVLVCKGNEVRPEDLPQEKMRATHTRSNHSHGFGRQSTVVEDIDETVDEVEHDTSPPKVLKEWWNENAEQDERQRIIDALEAAGGNQTKAAELLNISRRTLINRLDKYGIPRPRKGR